MLIEHLQVLWASGLLADQTCRAAATQPKICAHSLAVVAMCLALLQESSGSTCRISKAGGRPTSKSSTGMQRPTAHLSIAGPAQGTARAGACGVRHTCKVLIHAHLGGGQVTRLGPQLLGQACREALSHAGVRIALPGGPGTLPHLCSSRQHVRSELAWDSEQ